MKPPDKGRETYQTIPVFHEHSRIPRGVIHIQTNKPAKLYAVGPLVSSTDVRSECCRAPNCQPDVNSFSVAIEEQPVRCPLTREWTAGKTWPVDASQVKDNCRNRLSGYPNRVLSTASQVGKDKPASLPMDIGQHQSFSATFSRRSAHLPNKPSF